MKTLVDPQAALTSGLADIRREFAVPTQFPPEVLAAAGEAARKPLSDHVDRTDMPFVTLDPASSTDLDQAFAIEASGNDLLLHYAIADVAWFVEDDDPVDREAWARGETLYLPDGKASLYPAVLGEAAASLLPDGPRPAVVFTVRVDREGNVVLDGAERAIVRSRAKLAYASATDAELPAGFADLSDRMRAAEDRRGAARVDPPEQEIDATADGLKLVFRPRLESEDRNASLSLAANLAIADALLAHRTGLFRVMAAPDEAAVARLRHSAAGLGLGWSPDDSLDTFSRTLSAADPKQAAFMLAIRRAGGGATYAPYREGVLPWHAAMAATYAHATAPLRRLADRYVVRATLAIANGEAVPDTVTAAFEKLPKVMARADALAGRIDRAVIDLAEAALLADHVGTHYRAIVTAADDRGAQVQLCDLPVIVRVSARALVPGQEVGVTLTAVDQALRTTSFTVDPA